MYPQSFWLFGFKLKILKHFKQIRSHLKDHIELSSIPSEAVLRMFFMQALLLSPRAYFFCRPERKQGVSSLSVIPNEVRDASLTLGTTE